MKKLIYSLYKKHENNLIVLNTAQFIYNRILPFFKCKKNNQCFFNEDTENLLKVKIAFICDDMTYTDFCGECNSVFITPYNWNEVLKNFKPDILFCESAWSGISEYRDCWRGRIYKNHRVTFETRKDLFKLLDYCKKNKIKTVFWNKEDPTFFGNRQYDFIDTALKFEYIFTTAQECVEKYKALGHKNVQVLSFGFSPTIFNPLNSRPNENKAVFAGSWYNDQKNRCEDMTKIFNMLQKNCIQFDIIDRQSNSKNPVHKFPKKYESYVKEAIPFHELGQKMKKYRFAVNINTVTNSTTMFARRVFEMMAENKVIISNFSQGMKNMFGKNVWFAEEEFDFSCIEAICTQNLHNVFLNHTCRHRLEELLEVCEVFTEKKETNILIVLKNLDDRFLWAENKKVLPVYKKENEFFVAQTDEKFNADNIKDYDYFMFAEKEFYIDEDKINFLISQFLYLNKACGVAYKTESYKIIYRTMEDTKNYNVMFNISNFKLLNENIESNTNRIYVV